MGWNPIDLGGEDGDAEGSEWVHLGSVLGWNPIDLGGDVHRG